MTTDEALPFVVALAIGLLLGFERERHHRDGVHQAAGSRTMALLGLSGAVCAHLGTGVVIAGLAIVGLLVVVGYRRTSLDDPGTTTEIASIAAFLLGAMAIDHAGLAAGIAIAAAVILASKERLHAFARDVVTDAEMEDALKLLVMAFVILPLLPTRQLGPYGVLDPRRIWQLVIALTAISWVGYVATRTLGAKRGLALAGLAGGFVSASATTASMGRLSRTLHASSEPLTGAQLASVSTYVQLLAIVGVADRSVVREVWPAAVAGGGALLAGIAVAEIRARRRPMLPADAQRESDAAEASAPERPFALRPVLVLAGVLTGALLLARWAADVFGSSGAAIAAGGAGLADAHAASLAVVTLHAQEQLGMSTCLIAIAAALGTNTIVKCVLAFLAGGRGFGTRFVVRVVPSFALSITWLISTALAV